MIAEDHDLVLGLVTARRLAQEKKWGPSEGRRSPDLAVLVEEVGEVANAMQEGTLKDLENELLDVAAVAVAQCEALLRGDLTLLAR